MSEIVVIEYVVEVVGETTRVTGELVTFVCDRPSDHNNVHGPKPVSAAEIVAEAPLQRDAVPETVAVGGGFTVTVATPEDVPVVQFKSESATTV